MHKPEYVLESHMPKIFCDFEKSCPEDQTKY